MKVIIASNEATADDVLAIALLAVAANKTPQVVRTNDPKVIQDALEDKNVYVLGGGRTSPLRKNFDGDNRPPLRSGSIRSSPEAPSLGTLSLVVKYLEGYFPEGWQAPEGWQVPLTGDFSLDLVRAIEMVREQALSRSARESPTAQTALPNRKS